MTDQKDKDFAVPPPRPKKATNDGFAVPPPRPKKTTTNDEFAAPPPRPKKQTGSPSSSSSSTERESISEKDNTKEPITTTDNNITNNTDNNNVNKDDQTPPPPQLKYKKPDWAGVASYDYSLEVIKDGISIDKIHGPRKDFVTIGRLPLCDILMEHPSLSRYHAVIQFNQEGDAFLYDLDSGYGTRVNKKTIEARTYVPLKSGDQIRFAESTRLCIFDTEKPQDSVDDENDDDDELISEEETLLKHRTRAADVEHAAEDEDDQGISWGFQEDAIEEDDDDEIETNAKSDAHLLSIESEKMAMADAKRRRKDLETMYGDDDSDEELYDKTDIKKRKAMKKEQKAETHEDLVKRQSETEIKIKELKKQIEKKKMEDEESKKKAKEENDDLDSYMENLSKTTNTSSASMFALQKELKNLEKEHARLVKLVKITKPIL